MSASPFASFAVGVNAYAVPTVAVVPGVPVMVGAVFVPEEPDTVMSNAGSEAEDTPSEAMIITWAYVPAVVGVPETLPVDVLNVAHDGLLRIERVSALPSGSFAVGLNAYA